MEPIVVNTQNIGGRALQSQRIALKIRAMRTIVPIILLVAAMLSPQQGQAKAISAQSVLQAGISIVDSEVSNDITYADAVTLEEAVRRVRQQYGGRIVSAETRRSGDRRMHVIKVLTKDGRVRTVRIAAE